MNITIPKAARFLDGDEQAISEVYSSCHRLIFFIVSSYLSSKEDIEDAYEETFRKVLSAPKGSVDPNKLHSYLCLTARNTAIDMSKKNHPASELDEDSTPAATEDSGLDYLLPYNIDDTDKEIIGYRLVFSLNWEEIKELTSIPVSTLKERYKKSLAKLKREMKK